MATSRKKRSTGSGAAKKRTTPSKANYAGSPQEVAETPEQTNIPAIVAEARAANQKDKELGKPIPAPSMATQVPDEAELAARAAAIKAQAERVAAAAKPSKVPAIGAVGNRDQVLREGNFEGIAVLGSNPMTVNAAPFDDPKWRIYACSPHNLTPSMAHGRNPNLRYLNGGTRPDGGKYRVDEWFENHLPLAHETRPYHYLRALETLPFVWVRDADALGPDPRTEGKLSLIPGAVPFPMEELTREFGQYFWTSSISLMMAMAIHDCLKYKIPKMGVFGVMQASDNEYTYQRPGIQFMIHEALRQGINFVTLEQQQLHIPQDVQW